MKGKYFFGQYLTLIHPFGHEFTQTFNFSMLMSKKCKKNSVTYNLFCLFSLLVNFMCHELYERESQDDFFDLCIATAVFIFLPQLQ